MQNIARATPCLRSSEQEPPVPPTSPMIFILKCVLYERRIVGLLCAPGPDGRALEGLLADLPRDDLRAEAPCLRATAGMAVLVRQLDGWCRRVFPPAFSGGMGGKSVDDAYADGLANGNLGRWQVARPTFENISARPRLAWLCRSLLGLVGFQLWHPSFLASMRSTNDGSLSMATMRLARLNDIVDDVSRALFWERQIGPSSVCKADIRKSFDTTSPRLAL